MKKENKLLILIGIIVIIFLLIKYERVIKIKAIKVIPPDVIAQPPFHRPRPIDYQFSTYTIATPFR